MTAPDRDTPLREALAALGEARALAEASARAAGRASAALSTTLQTAREGALNTPTDPAAPAPEAPACAHTAAHRPGRPARIAADPELYAFIRARVDRLTFHAIAAEVAATFPPARRVSATAIHRYWQKHWRGLPRAHR